MLLRFVRIGRLLHLEIALKAFPRGKVAADAFPTTVEGAFDFWGLALTYGKNAKPRSRTP